eukprot:m.102948 g.102948  ORF g.102948 m.102948 type:complete len:99 (-) comp9087_c0_seq1:1134-1430(-)
MSFLDKLFESVTVWAEPEEPEEEEEEEEEEDEEELEDPLVEIREQCGEKCQKFKEELVKCEERVNSKSKTEETCLQELFDFLHCVDHCVSHKLFDHLK